MSGFYSSAELAQKWRCSLGTVRNRRRKGLISFFKAPGGRTYLYPVDAIEEFEKSFTSNGIIKPVAIEKSFTKQWRIK